MAPFVFASSTSCRKVSSLLALTHVSSTPASEWMAARSTDLCADRFRQGVEQGFQPSAAECIGYSLVPAPRGRLRYQKADRHPYGDTSCKTGHRRREWITRDNGAHLLLTPLECRFYVLGTRSRPHSSACRYCLSTMGGFTNIAAALCRRAGFFTVAVHRSIPCRFCCGKSHNSVISRIAEDSAATRRKADVPPSYRPFTAAASRLSAVRRTTHRRQTQPSSIPPDSAARRPAPRHKSRRLSRKPGRTAPGPFHGRGS